MITQEELVKHIKYDEVTGIFTNIKGAVIANKIDKYGYCPIYIKGKKYQAHRIAWLYIYGYLPVMIDHISTVKHHNYISNLREVTDSLNKQNRKEAMSTNRSGLLGVVYEKGRSKFRASITIYGVNKFLGRHKTPELAHQAYLTAKRELHATCTI